MTDYLLMAGIDIAAKTASVAISKHKDDKPKTMDIEQNNADYLKLHNRLKRYTATAQQP